MGKNKWFLLKSFLVWLLAALIGVAVGYAIDLIPVIWIECERW